MSTHDTRNPCTKLCRYDAADRCMGCFRTRAEVKHWKRLPDETKAAINARIAARGGTISKKDGRRAKKLDRKIRKIEAKLATLRARRLELEGPSAKAAE
ncbi:DUF1289 domain-containing protein [Azospirillum sp. YIM DDC1]|uniref:DUF1289 domain-containing protein n=1 Tax=Azospirillum aestuarii TaxID=2802052 RepID=A0ABS1HXR7_9PROT|nr:DUF1289 domain-containing protein [Azospirillum aestuarii]MBK3774114.1 DUF1289 domain-containing protein [Azospirillum brasilense]MBK4719619.1 DUF1289 domain-containing protein [Azospirillum aestuarii]TWA91639.1 hypothetical protein FBY14_103128 [Azospirillum brasilense]